VRLSRPRVVLRAFLLTVGGGFMLWKAWENAQGAGAAGDALLLRRVALVEALVGVLALGAAVIAFLSLRQRPRRRSLSLRHRAPPR
jgi:hypothetical protein